MSIRHAQKLAYASTCRHSLMENKVYSQLGPVSGEMHHALHSLRHPHKGDNIQKGENEKFSAATLTRFRATGCYLN